MYVNAPNGSCQSVLERAAPCGTSAVKICVVAIRQRDYKGLRGLFHDRGVMGLGVARTYGVYISSLAAGFGLRCLRLFIREPNMKLLQLLQTGLDIFSQSVKIFPLGEVLLGLAPLLTLYSLTWSGGAAANIGNVSCSN